MRFELVQAKAEHIRHVVEKDPNSFFVKPILTAEAVANLENNPLVKAVLADGVPVAVGGIGMYWPDRGEVWVMIDQTAGKYFLGIHRCVVEFLDSLKVRRIEAAARCDFKAGHRWIKMLGFKLEAERLEAYAMDGNDYSLYSRVRRHH